MQFRRIEYDTAKGGLTMTIKDLIKILSTIDETMTVDMKASRDLSRRGFDILDIELKIFKPIPEKL